MVGGRPGTEAGGLTSSQPAGYAAVVDSATGSEEDAAAASVCGVCAEEVCESSMGMLSAGGLMATLTQCNIDSPAGQGPKGRPARRVPFDQGQAVDLESSMGSATAGGLETLLDARDFGMLTSAGPKGCQAPGVSIDQGHAVDRVSSMGLANAGGPQGLASPRGPG